MPIKGPRAVIANVSLSAKGVTKTPKIATERSIGDEPDCVDGPQQRQEGEPDVEVLLAQVQLVVGAHLGAGEVHGVDDRGRVEVGGGGAAAVPVRLSSNVIFGVPISGKPFEIRRHSIHKYSGEIQINMY